MAGWHEELNGTSVSATERLRGVLPKLKRPVQAKEKIEAEAPAPERTEPTIGLHHDRLGTIAAYIGEYPTDESERRLCNITLHEPPKSQKQVNTAA